MNKATDITVFIENGQPKNIREIGPGYEIRSDTIEIPNKKSLLHAGCGIATGDFHLRAKLAIKSSDDKVTFVIGTKAAGINGFQRLTDDSWPQEVLNNQHLFLPLTGVAPGVPFIFEVTRKGQRNLVLIDKKSVKHFLFGGELIRAGFCAYEGTLRVYEFSVRGAAKPLS